MKAEKSLSVTVDLPGTFLEGEVVLPEQARSLVVFAHGSGSSRFSPRNRFVAEVLHGSGIGTFLFDLLTAEEEEEEEPTGRYRFDIPLLGDRLLGVLSWLERRSGLPRLPVGLFGSSTGAAAALLAAAERPGLVQTVVSRGGRPDLALPVLDRVTCPVLLLVGSLDFSVIEMNREAARRLSDVHVTLVEGATHLFAEPGTLEEVATRARDWFVRHLAPASLEE
jgi:pimeloyl-ACP methyl ester carboxylesterase